jgi:hypothetical protein
MALTPEQRASLDQHLSGLAAALDGALDSWTLVCLTEVVPDREGFLRAHLDRLSGRLGGLQEFLAGTGPAVGEGLRQLADDHRALGEVFRVLAAHRSAGWPELERAVRQLLDLHQRWRESIEGLAATVGGEVSYWRSRGAEQVQHIDSIRERLPELFRSAQAPPTVVTG